MIFTRNSRDIALMLRGAITHREVEAGTVYEAAELAQELDVGPEVVRQAFHFLRDEGWIALEEGDRAVVRPMTHLSIAAASHL